MAPTVASATRSPPSEATAEKTVTILQNQAPKQSKPLGPPHTKALNSTSQQTQQKKPHRKPIIDWFQRKLGGTAKGKRTLDESLSKGNGRGLGAQRAGNRVVSSPVTGPGGRQQAKLDAMGAAAAARRKTVSLNEDNGIAPAQHTRHSDDDRDESSSINDSLVQESVWGPNSVQEADEDASLRPLPPSSPPSPSPSRSSSSYLSDPRTFKSIAASTKPTTLLSIDLHGNGGMAHIAQAPYPPTRFSHARSSSTTTSPLITGAVPPSPQTSSRPSSVQDILNATNASAPTSNTLIIQAPLHTTHHPRNNPRPLSPPMDDASLLTLASSAYANPGLRVDGPGMPGWSSTPSAIGGGGDSVSHFGVMIDADAESTSQLVIDDERLDDRDADASLRALRPRSTRRGSWESEVSRWSARIQVTGPPSLGRERSLWTTNSIRTGAFSGDNVYIDNDRADSEVNVDNVEEKENRMEDRDGDNTCPLIHDEINSTTPDASVGFIGKDNDSKATVANEEISLLVEPHREETVKPPIDQNNEREQEEEEREQEGEKVENHVEPDPDPSLAETKTGESSRSKETSSIVAR